jgi:alpha-tubulin suppressor-like RCC1 family protein
MGLLSAFEPLQMGTYWSRITAGGWHACAMFVTENDHGEVACWGDNISGQVGAGSLHDRIDSPLNVVGGRVYRQVSAGRTHTCALSRYTLSGNVAGASPGPAVVQCWGRNNAGQLGDLTTANSRVPVTAIHPQAFVVVRPWPPT